jgi:hypothetical protein
LWIYWSRLFAAIFITPGMLSIVVGLHNAETQLGST